jgi:alpha/beta superfamily hydrolase
MGVVVFCHPHPRYGGTMHAPLMYRVTRGLVELGYAVLRFNFRGVGASTGTLGTGEVEDVDTAVTAARRFQPRVGVAGWSFGALASLRWQDLERDASPYVGIGLPTDMIEVPLHLPPAPRTLIIGDHDQFTTVDATRRFAAQIEAGVEVLPGSDHFFAFRHHRLVEIMDRTFAQRVDR